MMMMMMMNKQTSRIKWNRSTLVCNCRHVMCWHVSYGQVACWEQSTALSHDGGTRKVWRKSLTHGSSVSALFTSVHGCQSSRIKTGPCTAAPYQCIWTERFSFYYIQEYVYLMMASQLSCVCSVRTENGYELIMTWKIRVVTSFELLSRLLSRI